MQHPIWCNGLNLLITKRANHVGLWRWWSYGIRWHGGSYLAKTFKRKSGCHCGWKKGLEIFFLELETKASYGFQTQQLCSLCRVKIIRVVMAWCTRCELKGSITSQAPLSWWGRHLKWMINEKHTNNIW
jgi:hypothetical protein